MLKRIGLLLIPLLFLLSCEGVLPPPSRPLPLTEEARLLLYIHSTSTSPPEIAFTISRIDILKGEEWIEVLKGPVEINSLDLVDRQKFITEVRLKPGLYKALRIKISQATLRSRMGVVNLALPEPDGMVIVEIDTGLKGLESYVISLNWNPEESIVEHYRFQPSLTPEKETPSPKGLIIFVSNSGTDYISAIDRDLERVIGAITVGDGPTGMVQNVSGDRLYVVNSRSKSISIIDTTRFAVIGRIPLTAGREPRDVAFVPEGGASTEGKLYVINRASDDVSVVDTVTRRVLKTINVGRFPSSIVADTGRREVYVANEGSNSLTVISATSDSVVAEIHVGNRPKGVVLRKDKDRIYVFNEGSSTISVVSPSSRKVLETIPLTQPPERGIEGFGGRMFVVNTSVNSISFYNPFDVITRSIEVGPAPFGLGIDESRNRLYVTVYGGDKVFLFDPILERKIKDLTVGKNPYGVVVIER